MRRGRERERERRRVEDYAEEGGHGWVERKVGGEEAPHTPHTRIFSHSPGYVPQVIRSYQRDAPVQTRPGNVSARILKRNQFATSARYLAASSALIIATRARDGRPWRVFSLPPSPLSLPLSLSFSLSLVLLEREREREQRGNARRIVRRDVGTGRKKCRDKVFIES